jgi:glucose/arabinose dehydrogenase
LSLRASAATLLTAVALAAAPGTAGAAGDGVGGAELRGVGTFAEPVHVAAAPGFGKLLFVVEQRGVIRVLRRGTPLEMPFLDIRDLTVCGSPSTSCGEQGLLSVAFPPGYRRTRRFYVYYVNTGGDISIDEFRRSRRNPAVAVRGSQRPVLAIPHPLHGNHNGGQLQFRGELLYAATGDGGGGGDEPNNAQSRDLLLGKILRIDPRPTRGGRPYGVPRSNPFVGRPGRDEIFSLGLRNPFRFSFEDRARKPDRIVIGDVGQWRYEEIDYVTVAEANGANFGWDAFEGFLPYSCGGDCPNGGTPDPGGTVRPIFAYGHGGFAAPGGPSGCSVTGGYVVRDPGLTSLLGRYVYGDFCGGEIRSLIPGLGGAADEKGTGLSPGAISSFGETPNGRLFVTSHFGGVFRIAPSP